jgi:hypothetical protein
MSTPTDTRPEETPEPTGNPAATVEWRDEDGKLHTDHPVHTECANGCYQVIKP